MEKNKNYYLVAQKIKGDVIPIQWTNIPVFNGGLNGNRLQTIDQFTTRFENEKELKDLLKQYNLELGLSVKKKKIAEDSLCDFLSRYLLSKYDSNTHSHELKRTLSSMGDIGNSTSLKLSLKNAAKSSNSQQVKESIYKAIIQKEFIEIIMGDNFPGYLKKEIYEYISTLEFSSELTKELVKEAESIELNYVFESFPLKIIFYNGRSQVELYNGVAYQQDLKFLDRDYIFQYLISKTTENDFDLLNRIIRLYEKNQIHSSSIKAIREYIDKIKSQQESFVPVPKQEIEQMIKNEVEQFDQETNSTKLGRNGLPLIDYYRLRKLGMFLSSYNREKEYIYQTTTKKDKGKSLTFEKRLAQIPDGQTTMFVN